jgi:chromosome segregation ATPase
MEVKKEIVNALKEIVVPELTKIKEDVNNVKGVLELTNKRLDDINLHLADQSRRIDETNKKIDSTREELGQRIDETNRRIDETNDRLNRLYEVIVRRDEHSTLDQKVLALEKDVQELKLKMAV